MRCDIVHSIALYAPAGLPKEKLGVDVAVVPPVAAPELAGVPIPPKSEGFAALPASPVGLNPNGLDAGCDAPAVACVPPKSGLDVAGVVDAAPNSELPPAAPPKRDEVAAGVLVPDDALLFALPKRFEVPELAAPPPNRGLFGVLLPLFPKLKAMTAGSVNTGGVGRFA